MKIYKAAIAVLKSSQLITLKSTQYNYTLIMSQVVVGAITIIFAM